jgi:hypothetical protein
LFLGLVSALIGVAQLAALVALAVTANLFFGLSGPGKASGESFLALLVFGFPIWVQLLWSAPLAAGIGGMLLGWRRSPRTGQALIWVAVILEILAVIPDLREWGFDLSVDMNPFSGRPILALPVGLALAALSMNSHSRASQDSGKRR